MLAFRRILARLRDVVGFLLILLHKNILELLGVFILLLKNVIK
jgi:hypothetical protein